MPITKNSFFFCSLRSTKCPFEATKRIMELAY